MEKTMGMRIGELRKAQGLTQLELARQLGITDKAVSKWERDLSCPDIAILPRLAALLQVTVDDLMQAAPKAGKAPAGTQSLPDLILRAMALAMGVCVVVTGLMNALTPASGMTLLGIGLTCLAVFALRQGR